MKFKEVEKLAPMTVNAALAAYAISNKATASTIRDNSYGQKVPFSNQEIKIYQTDRPLGFEEKIDACYVGETDQYVILAFRGTLSDFTFRDFRDFVATVEDWINDADAKPVTYDDLPGKVHQGFKDSFERLKTQGCITDVVGRMNANPNKDLIITGHSKGGGITPIAAMYLVDKSNIAAERIHPIMFEPARSGDVEFANAFNETFPTDSNPAIRYAYQDDMVPHMPPSNAEIPFFKENLKFEIVLWLLEGLEDLDSWDYASVGTLNFINWKDEIETHEPHQQHGLFPKRMKHILKMFSKNIGQVGCDHTACCGKGCDPHKAYFYKVITGENCP